MTSPSPNARIGTPLPPPESEYAHMTQKQRKMAGYPFKPLDPLLAAERDKCRKRIGEFNSTAPEERERRRSILRDILHPECKDVKIYIKPIFTVEYGYNIRVGDNFFANIGCTILDSAAVDIGENCMLGPQVDIYTTTHPLDPFHRRDPESEEYHELAYPIKIGHTCWIGGKSTICPGVTIGDNVVVGAGSVVTKDVPSNVVVAGNPARIIRYLDGADVPQELLEKNKKP